MDRVGEVWQSGLCGELIFLGDLANAYPSTESNVLKPESPQDRSTAKFRSTANSTKDRRVPISYLYPLQNSATDLHSVYSLAKSGLNSPDSYFLSF